MSYEVEAFLRENPYIDGVMIGEGEDTFRELSGSYAHKRKQQGMPVFVQLLSVIGG